MERVVEEGTTEQERRSQKMKILDSYLNELDELGVEFTLSIENKFTNRDGEDPFVRVYWLHIGLKCERFTTESALICCLENLITARSKFVKHEDVIKEFEIELDTKYSSASRMLAVEHPDQYEEATLDYILRNYEETSPGTYRRKQNEQQ